MRKPTMESSYPSVNGKLMKRIYLVVYLDIILCCPDLAFVRCTSSNIQRNADLAIRNSQLIYVPMIS